MVSVKTALKNEVIVAVAGTIKGSKLVTIYDYKGTKTITRQGVKIKVETGEVSNYYISVAISYKNALKKDLVALNNFDLKTIEFNPSNTDEQNKGKYPMELLLQAKDKVVHSLNVGLATEKERQLLRLQGDKTVALSDAQIDAYTQLAPGVKRHNDSGLIHVYGLLNKKVQVMPPTEKKEPTKNGILVLAQNAIKYGCDFRSMDYRNFIAEKSQIRMQGVIIL